MITMNEKRARGTVGAHVRVAGSRKQVPEREGVGQRTASPDGSALAC